MAALLRGLGAAVVAALVTFSFNSTLSAQQPKCGSQSGSLMVLSDVAKLPVDHFRPDTCGFLRHLDKGAFPGVITQREVLAYIDRFGSVPGEAEAYEVAVMFSTMSASGRQVETSALFALKNVAYGNRDVLDFSKLCALPAGDGAQLAELQEQFDFEGPVRRANGGYVDSAGNKLTFRRNYTVSDEDPRFQRYSTLAVVEDAKGLNRRSFDVEPVTAAFLSDFIETDVGTLAASAAENPGGGAYTAMIQVLSRDRPS